MAQNACFFPYTSEKKIPLFGKKYFGFTYKNRVPTAYIMKASFKKFLAGVSFSDNFV